MSATDDFITEFKAKKWESNPFETMADILAGNSANVPPFVERVLMELPESGTFFHTALTYLPEENWPRLVEMAVQEWLKNSEHETAESVFAYASLQFPNSLHPWLSHLLQSVPNKGAYYEEWPWRRTGIQDALLLEREIVKQSEQSVRHALWLRGLESRHPEVIARMLALRPLAGIKSPATSHMEDVNVHLRQIAREEVYGVVRQLASTDTYHFIFPEGHFAEPPSWRKPFKHPTWSLSPVHSQVRVGGIGTGQCSYCSGPMHRLLSSEQFPKLMDVFEGGPLYLDTCLACLGWEVPSLYFEHDKAGFPTMLNLERKKLKPQVPAEPLADCTAWLAGTPPRWQMQDWALSNGRENLFRFGGEPCWIQSAQYPSCLKCKSTMPFLAQLDSDLPTSDGGEWLWGSGGICYIFWCKSCRMSSQLWQCT